MGTFGQAGMFSLYPTKNMTSGEGGMVSCGTAETARQVRLLRNQGMEKQYANEVAGYNNRMTDIHAAIGRVQLGKLAGWTETRRENAAFFDAHLRGVVTPVVRDGAQHVYHQYTIRIEGASAQERDAFATALREEHRVGCGVYYPTPVHRLETFRTEVDLPVTEQLAREVLSLPVHPSAFTTGPRADRRGREHRGEGGCVSMAKNLRAGLIGLGMMGRHHARNLRSLEGVDLVAVADAYGDPHGAAPELDVLPDVEGLIAAGIDYAVVAVPTQFHRDVALRLAEAGVHTLVEKPLAFDIGEAEEIAAAFEDAGLVGAVGYIERYNPALQEMRRRIADGQLGRSTRSSPVARAGSRPGSRMSAWSRTSPPMTSISPRGWRSPRTRRWRRPRRVAAAVRTRTWSPSRVVSRTARSPTTW